MTTQTYQGLISGSYNTATRLKLTTLPSDFDFSLLLPLSSTLTTLDLSNTHLSTLPPEISQLSKLKILFLSSCAFTTFPNLSQCYALEMVAFKSNDMKSVPENHFPPNLRWLILTNNAIEEIPKSISVCARLQKCMLAGNKLKTLPEEMKQCRKLGLLRISANRIDSLPEWLFNMPELAFLAFAGNPCATYSESNPTLVDIAWNELQIRELLGEGASGIISRGIWTKDANEKEVAVKLFKGEVTSDGSPFDEMAACITAGKHTNLIDPIAKIHGHPEKKKGLVLELISPEYTNLGGPPNLDSCTRDTYTSGMKLDHGQVRQILSGIAAAAEHLHKRGISHGDLYAHNILVRKDGHALLGDFGAATIYQGCGIEKQSVERLEVLAFAHLIEDMLKLMEDDDTEEAEKLRAVCRQVWSSASNADVSKRPLFSEIVQSLVT